MHLFSSAKRKKAFRERFEGLPPSYCRSKPVRLGRMEARTYLGEAARRALRKPGTVTLARDAK
jgi:hypothetical protein